MMGETETCSRLQDHIYALRAWLREQEKSGGHGGVIDPKHCYFTGGMH